MLRSEMVANCLGIRIDVAPIWVRKKNIQTDLSWGSETIDESLRVFDWKLSPISICRNVHCHSASTENVQVVPGD